MQVSASRLEAAVHRASREPSRAESRSHLPSAGGGSRTHTLFRATGPEPILSANSSTPAWKLNPSQRQLFDVRHGHTNVVRATAGRIAPPPAPRGPRAGRRGAGR